MLTVNLLQAQAQGGSGMELILMIVIMFAILYFFMIRPQNKQRKKLQEFQNSLKVGDQVMISGGIWATVKDTNPDKSFVTVEISKGVCIDVERAGVYAPGQQDQATQR